VEIVFNGYASGSGPQAGCAGAYAMTSYRGRRTGGTPVVMTGWGLSQVQSITFQGAQATIIGQTDQRIAFRTPPCNFCRGSAPWYSNVVLNLKNGSSVILPASIAGPTATAAWTYTHR
jgi:Tol biopolymer transport system component